MKMNFKKVIEELHQFQGRDLLNETGDVLNHMLQLLEALLEFLPISQNDARYAQDGNGVRFSEAVLDLLAPLDVFEMVAQLTNLLTHSSMHQQRQTLIAQVLPRLLCSYIQNRSLYKYVSKGLREGTLQSLLYDICTHTSTGSLKLGILTFTNLHALFDKVYNTDHNSRLNANKIMLSEAMLFSTIPNLKFCMDLATTLDGVLESRNNELIYECLLQILLEKSKPSRQLVAMFLTNSDKLLQSLEMLSSDPSTTEVNSRCIEAVFDFLVREYITHGNLELPDILKRHVLEKHATKFSMWKSHFKEKSIVYVMEVIENELDVLNSSMLLAHFLSCIKHISRMSKLNLYDYFGKARCKISLTCLFMDSIYCMLKLIMKEYDSSYVISETIQKEFDIFKLPPISKSNYLCWNNFNIGIDPVDTVTANADCVMQGILLEWKILGYALADEARSNCILTNDQGVNSNLLSNYLKMVYACMFISEQSFIALLKKKTGSSGEDISYSSESVFPTYRKLLNAKLVEILESLFDIEFPYTFAKDFSFALLSFFHFCGEICSEELEYIEVADEIISLINPPYYEKSIICQTIIENFINKFDPQCKRFMRVRTAFNFPISATTSEYIQLVGVSLTDFDGLYENDKFDYHANKLAHSSSSSFYSALGIRGGDTFSGKGKGREMVAYPAGRSKEDHNQQSSGRAKSIHVDMFE